MLILGAVTQEQQDPSALHVLHEAIEYSLGLRVDPLEILEDDQQRLNLALPEHEVRHRVESPMSAFEGLQVLPVLVVDRDVEQGQER